MEAVGGEATVAIEGWSRGGAEQVEVGASCCGLWTRFAGTTVASVSSTAFGAVVGGAVAVVVLTVADLCGGLDDLDALDLATSAFELSCTTDTRFAGKVTSSSAARVTIIHRAVTVVVFAVTHFCFWLGDRDTGFVTADALEGSGFALTLQVALTSAEAGKVVVKSTIAVVVFAVACFFAGQYIASTSRPLAALTGLGAVFANTFASVLGISAVARFG